jgi:hypothetical protein
MATEVVYDPTKPIAYVNGQVIPIGKTPITGDQLLEMLRTELNEEYSGQDPRKIGLTNAEAIKIEIVRKAADGDKEAINMLYDRVIGKPIQQVNQVNVTASLKEFLSGLKEARANRTREIDPFE